MDNIPVIGTDTITSETLENYNQINSHNYHQNYFADITQSIGWSLMIENWSTGDQSKDTVNVPCGQEKHSIPTPKRHQEKKKVCENQTVEVIKINSEKRKKILNDLVIEIKNRNEKHPIEILFENLAKTVMSFPPALAAEARLKIKNILIDLKYRSLVSQIQENDFVSCSPSRDPASEYCSSS